MDAKEFVPLALLSLGGEIQGKTKLQKTVYFLGLLTRCVDDLGYRPHFYGPYSDDVADAVHWLKTIGAVDQCSSGMGATDRSGFEIRRHDFRLNAGGKHFAELMAQRNSRLWEKIKEAASAFKRAGELDYESMSVAAKTYFMLVAHQKAANHEELARLASKFGWDVTPQQIQNGVSFLDRLGLVQITPD
jgi:uncharacterized protein